jgi:DegV family protein with EDD domain
MSKIALVTDSTAYLPDEFVQQHEITVVPLSVNFGSVTRREGVDLGTREFFDMLPTVKELPSTSQPAVGEFVQAFERLTASHDSVIGMFLSAGLSGTYNAALTAANMVDGDITIIDSRLTSHFLASMVREAVAMRDAGNSKEEIVARMQHMIENRGAYFIVDSLEHLHRGGRISGVSALVGSLLQVKPILYVTPEGKLDALEKVRTRKKALDRVLELFREDKAKHAGQPIRLAVVYTNNLDDAKEFQGRIRQEFPDVEPDLSELGPVIGTHVGPGILAIVYYFG